MSNPQGVSLSGKWPCKNPSLVKQKQNNKKGLFSFQSETSVYMWARDPSCLNDKSAGVFQNSGFDLMSYLQSQ